MINFGLCRNINLNTINNSLKGWEANTNCKSLICIHVMFICIIFIFNYFSNSFQCLQETWIFCIKDRVSAPLYSESTRVIKQLMAIGEKFFCKSHWTNSKRSAVMPQLPHYWMLQFYPEKENILPDDFTFGMLTCFRDGNNRRGSCFHSAEMTDPWWAVDMGQKRIITKVFIYNRADSYSKSSRIY